MNFLCEFGRTHVRGCDEESFFVGEAVLEEEEEKYLGFATTSWARERVDVSRSGVYNIL